MKLQIGRKKLKIVEVSGFKNRFKCMKFYLDPLDFAYCFPKRRSISTYFYCQRVDVVMTDINDTILFMYPNLKSEKRKWHRKRTGAYYVYILPVGSCEHLKHGEKLKKVK